MPHSRLDQVLAVDHTKIRVVVALLAGLLTFYLSYQWITDTERPERRAQEETVVLAARAILFEYVGTEQLQVSDPLQRVREAGKVYIYPESFGWEVSGHYQRSDESAWHDFLITLNANNELIRLLVNDDAAYLLDKSREDPKFEALPQP